jgi:membrane protease subunit HflC
MTRPSLLPWLVIAVAVLIVLGNTLFIVEQREEAVVLQLGVPVGVIHAPGDANGAGLNVKVPFMQRVVKFDRRNISMDADQEEVLLGDETRLVIDAFLRYRIADPLQYYKTLHDEHTAQNRLSPLVNSSLRQIIGSVNPADIVSLRRDELMHQAKQDVARRAKAARFGIEVIDLRIKGVDYPASIRPSVFRRMQTQRQQQAAQYRAQGEQQKRQIMATADKQVQITLATAQETAAKTMGEGDAARTRIFAQSFGHDPSFAAFYRKLQAYETAMGQGDTTMVVTPDSTPGFLDVFEHGPQGGSTGGSGRR